MRGAARIALGVAAALAAAGCGSKKERSLLQIDVVPAPALTISSVGIMVTQEGSQVHSEQFAWEVPQGQTLKIGLYLPDYVDGSVTVEAVAYDASGATIATSEKGAGVVHAGEASAVVTLHLERSSPPAGDGGGPPPSDGGVGPPPSEGGVTGPPPDGSMGMGGTGGTGDGGPPDVSTSLAWRPAENLENDQVARSHYPGAAIDGKGNALVVWHEDVTLKSRRYDATAKSWGEIKVVENHGSIVSPVVKMGANGHATVLWNQYVADVGPMEGGVWAAHSKDGGNTWSPPKHVHAGPTYGPLELQVSRQGHARAAWEESANNMRVVWSGNYDDATGAWSNVAMVKAAEDPNDREPKIALDAQGGGLLVWTQRDDMMMDSTWGTSFAPNQPLKAPQLLDNYIMEGTSNPAVAIMPDGSKGLSLWVQRSSSTGYDIFSSDYAAGAWKPPVKVLTSPSWVSSPVMVIDQTAAVTVAFTQPIATAKSNVVAVRRIEGQGWSPVAPLEFTNQAGQRTDEDPYPVIGLDGVGTVHVAWARKMKAMDQNTYGVFTTRYVMGKWQPEVMIGLKDNLRADDPRLAVGEDGHAIIGFYYYDPSGMGLPDAYNTFAALFQ